MNTATVSITTKQTIEGRHDHYLHCKRHELRHKGIHVSSSELCALPSECNRIRQAPGNRGPLSDRLAARQADGTVLLFKDHKTTLPTSLHGASGDMFPISWAPTNYLSTASTEGAVVYWDLEGGDQQAMSLKTSWADRTINDIDWLDNHTMLVSTDGKSLAVLDTRMATPAAVVEEAHYDDVICGKHGPDNYVITCAGKDWVLRDLRALGTPLYYAPETHKDDIYALEWSPAIPTVFATGATDGSVRVWDLALVGREQATGDKEDGPPELVFDHRGHEETVNDLQWSSRPWTLVSAGGECSVQMWEPAQTSHRTVQPWDIKDDDVM
ncbi:histone acetyltransferase type B subunit 2 [Carpediemonas membranifera]|nr:histone acetyltransferase type B subunit 2 [Carpediemonas membranifera]|eukprot:KAG9395721.1 histone acetyltransferase type B subunit 2 [Carpediemonas membranifera]